VLVIGGTNRLDLLLQARKNGARIVQRLNGMNWLHRIRYTGIRHFLRSEQNNLLLSYIRRYLADEIVYQSDFSQGWWNARFHGTPAGERVVYNGVDTNEYSPGDGRSRPLDKTRVLIVEGRMGSGHQYGISNGINLCRRLAGITRKPVELVIVGDVPLRDRENWGEIEDVSIQWMGIVSREKIPALDRSAHIMFSAELNAACPNSLIEGLACGLPVVGFAVGSVPELVGENAGVYVPYGANHWKLEDPDIESLAIAAGKILENPEPFRLAARDRAVNLFSVERMIALYLDALVN
jgi:glycosyltransferase involved in cell wall biosynthesis